ncbi:MAG: UDP-2,3-diacylglucosamine diphosphatase [Deltaproteobacteria bacterium]|nr:UDP-2,3-diacylglucosamine diphosphatase [Deltaproteobacteria bacterium]MCL5791863.1 UDP-2,3-diacylglucosamine diphosphatase [Deltaproteobacteria bacterium]
MYCIFLSDAHLHGKDDPNQRIMVRFFKSLENEPPDALFLLGDIFDFWISPGGLIDPVYVSLLDSLKNLSEKGVRLYYAVGNHDFFVKDVLKNIFDVEIIDRDYDTTINGKRFHITHGDTIDYTDKGYRFLRAVLRSRFARIIVQIVPVMMLKNIAAWLSKQSRDVWTAKREMPAHVLDEYIEKKAMQGIEVLIAGHFHKPLIRELFFGERHIKYVNTGNWFNDYTYVIVRDDRIDLKFFR